MAQGPKTKAGKERSKMNALKFGTYSAKAREEIRLLKSIISQACIILKMQNNNHDRYCSDGD